MNGKFTLILFLFFVAVACTNKQNHKQAKFEIEAILNESLEQFDLLIKTAYKADRIPRTVQPTGEMHFANLQFDWTEGFFPGACWMAYSVTKDTKYKKAAEHFQTQFIEHRFLTNNHDLGFVFNNSFGQAFKITQNESYKQVLIDAGNSLITRFNANVGCIKSWDVENGWQAKRNWKFPVIIDNMMNLEMLFELSKLTGDTKYSEIAISHANVTAANHFRDDNSSYHVVDYDPETGAVRAKETAQGYAHESAWARGQAWALYGYTVCYRFTNDRKYLELAEKMADFYLSNKNLPADLVAYWDFNAPKIPNEPRDASAAAIVASALVELNNYSEHDYLSPAKKIVQSLSSKAYRAEIGTNNHFVLEHSVGSIPHQAEIDVPLNYADYYYLEALSRLLELANK